ncbi:MULTISPECIES: hypothetical protein [unclassified Frankia]|nr:MULTISPECIES: hypothetical protein [unclassified Frankia]
MGRIAGYTVADYLLQHATHTRRGERPPASLWTALRDHPTHPDDLARLANTALNYQVYTLAVPLLRQQADAGDRVTASRLADLLFEAGDRDGLRQRADAGDGDAARRLADLLAEAGDRPGAIDVLRQRADAGDEYATRQLADLLAETGDKRLRRYGSDVDGRIADGPTW